MKVTIDIDMTPQEARAFFGLPDVAPLQEVFMERMKTRMLEGIDAFDPKSFDPAKAMESYLTLYPQWMEAATKFMAGGK